MFDTFRNMKLIAAAASVVIATMIGAGVSKAEDQASLHFENTVDQEISLDVLDSYREGWDRGPVSIHLNRPTINGKPSVMIFRVFFKASKDKKGNINLRVTVHCGSNTDTVTYTRPPAGGDIKVLAGCRLTRP
jgi:hypothetical protein